LCFRLGKISLAARRRCCFLSDGNAEFTKKIGMDFDGSGFGLGTRSKRYSALVEGGVVKILNVEESAGIAEASTASKILKSL
jgi:peroxiredoxin